MLLSSGLPSWPFGVLEHIWCYIRTLPMWWMAGSEVRSGAPRAESMLTCGLGSGMWPMTGGGQLDIRKVPAHTSWEAVEAGKISALCRWGNMLTDFAARKGTTAHRHHHSYRTRLLGATALQYQVASWIGKSLALLAPEGKDENGFFTKIKVAARLLLQRPL